MQEHTVLGKHPLGIHCNTAFRHGRECIRMCAFTVDIPSGEDESSRIEGSVIYVFLRGLEVVAPPFSVTGYVRPVGDTRHLIQLTHGSFACNSSVVSLHIDAVQIGDRLDVSIIVVVDLSVVSDPFSPYFGHAFVGGRMLLRLPVGTGVMGNGVYVFIEHILSVFILKIDMIDPVVLSACRIVVGVHVVAGLAGQIAQDFFIHDGDLSFDRSLSVTDVGLGRVHDRPAALSVSVPDLKIRVVVLRPLIADIRPVFGCQGFIIVCVAPAGFGSFRSEGAAGFRCARPVP